MCAGSGGGLEGRLTRRGCWAEKGDPLGEDMCWEGK